MKMILQLIHDSLNIKKKKIPLGYAKVQGTLHCIILQTSWKRYFCIFSEHLKQVVTSKKHPTEMFQKIKRSMNDVKIMFFCKHFDNFIKNQITPQLS